MIAAVSPYHCRECGIEHIDAGIEIDGEPLCWVTADLCSRCHDWLQAQLEADARRYRHIRDRQMRPVDIAVGGVFAGRIPDNTILSGEDLDRAIDGEMGAELPTVATLERRLGELLAEIVDTPLFTGRDEVGGYSSPLEIRVGFFRPELSERAAELLEEAGL